ncbi:MAG: metal-binding protein [Latescibacteria bacterium DG_63]|nr:MAG: metal-binding protein [Latescibacteria bacterium DG_63]
MNADKREADDKIQCTECFVKSKVCRDENGTGPKFCPTIKKTETLARMRSVYEESDVKHFARMASLQEAECYTGRGEAKPYVLHPVKPRVLEVCQFAEKMGYKRLGVAYCSGLAREAGLLVEILERYGFEVVSVVCKVGGVPKETIGIKDDEKINIGEFESMCNPVGQAMILNGERTEFNILVGLCVGHDSLFLKYAEAPCTVLVVKDRVTGHNPAAALYTANSYYQRLLK